MESKELLPTPKFFMNRKDILKVRERALNCLATYTPTEAKIRMDALAVLFICNRALRANPLRYKLKRKED